MRTALFLFPIALLAGCLQVQSVMDEESDPAPPTRTAEEIELSRLARTCHGDGFARAVRTYIKSNGSEAAIPYLIHAFGNSCTGCPRWAQGVLAEIGKPAIRPLLDATAHGKHDVFGYLPETVAKFDPADVMPPLVGMLKDPRTPNRDRLVELVERLGPYAKDVAPALEWIIEDDESANLELQRDAATALCSIGPDAAPAGPAIVRLVKDLRLPDEARRARRRPPPTDDPKERILRPYLFGGDYLQASIGRLGPKAPGVLDFLLLEIARPHNDAAIDGIAYLGSSASDALPTLRARLATGQAGVRAKVCYALWKVGEPLDEVLKIVLQDLKHSDPERRHAALEVLKQIGQPAVGSAPDVLRLTKDPESHVRRMAVMALTSMKPPAETIMPSMMQLLADSDSQVQYDVIDCLNEYGAAANSLMPRMIELIKTHAWENPRPAAFALRELGAVPQVAVHDVISLLSNGDWVVRETAALLLRNMGPAASVAAPRLRELIKGQPQGDADLRSEYAEALLRVNPDSMSDQDLTSTLLDAKDESARLEAARLLWRIARFRERSIREIASGLSNPRYSLREFSAEVLIEAGPLAAPARDALVLALEDDEPSVRTAAKEALKKLSPDLR